MFNCGRWAKWTKFSDKHCPATTPLVVSGNFTHKELPMSNKGNPGGNKGPGNEQQRPNPYNPNNPQQQQQQGNRQNQTNPQQQQHGNRPNQGSSGNPGHKPSGDQRQQQHGQQNPSKQFNQGKK